MGTQATLTTGAPSPNGGTPALAEATGLKRRRSMSEGEALASPGAGWARTQGEFARVEKQMKADTTTDEERVTKIAGAVQTIIEALGEDVARHGLVKTPRRMAQLLVDCTSGYRKELSDVLNGAIFNEEFSEMVLIKDIDIFSLCEHHMVPFFGKVHIAYIPRQKILGLSKLARIAEMYSRRLQVQERLTLQIASAVQDAISPLGTPSSWRSINQGG